MLQIYKESKRTFFYRIYIEFKYHIVKEKIEERIISMIYYIMEDNIVDLLTKVLVKDKKVKLKNTIGLKA